MPEGVKQRRLQSPRITEVSGVDRPAHMRDGWFMRKSADAAGADQLLAALGRGARMPKTVEAATASTLLKSLTAEQRTLLVEDGGTEKLAKALTADQTTEFAKAADASDLQPLLDQLAQLWSSLRDLAEKEDPEVPSAEVDPATGVAPVAPVAPDAAAVLASPALAKSLGMSDETVAMIKALHEKNEADRQELAKALEAKADGEAITAFEKSYAGMGLDAKAVAPALRKFAEANPEAHLAITSALTKARDLDQRTASVLVREVGRLSVPGGESPVAQATSIAKSLVQSGEAKTIEQGVALAYQRNPALYEAARNGAGGE